ncbi:putative Fatty-acid desaturase, transmenbrane protein [Bradyrhizobium sp. ORS 278]|uniref:acyl-CoA desaturase n=1 Tax=Bradyrhizobium sp. (strain ORS 278) TaxID=114615 RepID=UPI0001508DCC|nr:acyl-CoA desaturase [Bradyrhizobium sp. ORS 278]CAL79311.1 putative Fatty-acid desaturase, transmenbrane protein [Bradyrhizobium sp. ORS 278]
MRDNRVLRGRHLHRLQRRHFILFDVLPFVGTLAALALLAVRPIGGMEIGLFAAMWLVTGLGLTVGYHRLFTHGAFTTTGWVSNLLIVMGSMAGRGPMISWAAMHRRHHELSDHDGDLHSPNLHGAGWRRRLHGFVHAQLTWMVEHDYPNVAHYVPDLIARRSWVNVNGYYYAWVLLGLAIPAVLGGLISASVWGVLTGFLWGGVVRMFVVEQTMSAINSLNHMLGSRPFQTRGDNSRNLGVMAWLAWGEGWHNNHHAFPYSAAFGLRWSEFDLGFLFIRALEAAGLAWNVKVPAPERITARMTAHPAEAAPDFGHG